VERSFISLSWSEISANLKDAFGTSDDDLQRLEKLGDAKESLLKIYEDMLLAR